MFWTVFWIIWILIGFTSTIAYFKLESGKVTVGDVLIAILFSWLGAIHFLVLLDEVFNFTTKLANKFVKFLHKDIF